MLENSHIFPETCMGDSTAMLLLCYEILPLQCSPDLFPVLELYSYFQ